MPRAHWRIFTIFTEWETIEIMTEHTHLIIQAGHRPHNLITHRFESGKFRAGGTHTNFYNQTGIWEITNKEWACCYQSISLVSAMLCTEKKEKEKKNSDKSYGGVSIAYIFCLNGAGKFHLISNWVSIWVQVNKSFVTVSSLVWFWLNIHLFLSHYKS